ncbi:MAG: alanine--glyoxylate aminotransferase family protein [Cloacibacillus sp.]
MKKYLLTPGPVEVPPEVLQAAGRSLISHRCEEFSELFRRIEEKLHLLFESASPVVILPSSGTGALECAAVNFLSEKDKFISLSCGAFGDRFREIAERTGARGLYADFEPGTAPDAASAAQLVYDNPEAAAILITHNETSTGVTAPLEEIISALPRTESSPLVIVDGVSSVGAIECLPEKWGVDVLCTASQKGLMTPPGLGFVWLSKRALERLSLRRSPSYYFDLKLHLKNMTAKSFANPYTPPVSLYFALDAALDLILKDGKEAWFSKRKKYARAFAAALEAAGFELFVKDPALRSPGLTAFFLKDGQNEAFRSRLSALGVTTAGGQGALSAKLVRAAHYSDWGERELSEIIFAMCAANETDAACPLKKALDLFGA